MIKKWTLVPICVFLFLLLSVMPVCAEIVYDFEQIDSNSEDAKELTIETSKTAGDKWTLPYVSAHSAILMDFESGDVIYDRDAHKQRPPASTTKVLTAIIALEMAELEEVTTVSDKAGQVGESSLHLNKGNKLKLSELIEGALVKSGNDACVAIAEQTAGSLDDFVRMMNLKAVALGAVNSNFVNPHGLPDKNHYATAYDLAIIARYAMKNPSFCKYVSQKISTINYEQPQKSQIIKNTNKLLWNYPFADGIKTGTTNAAGKCLIASASKDGRRLICVVLNAPDRFGDAKRLLEWGFEHTEIIQIGNKGDMITTYSGSGMRIPAVLGEDLTLCLEKAKINDLRLQAEFGQGIYPPVHQGEVIGSYNILLGEKLVKQIPLVSQQDYIGSPIHFFGSLNLIIDQFLDFLDKKG